MSTDRNADIVIVTGPPGSGKTTVCRALADAANRSAHVESDWFFNFLRAGRIPPHLREASQQNDTVMDIITDTVVAYAHDGYLVYWDGIVGPWYLDRVMKRIPSELRVHYVVLRSSRDLALDRVAKRDNTNDLAGAETMYDHFRNLGQYEAHTVNSNDPVEIVVQDVARDLRSGRFALTDRPTE